MQYKIRPSFYTLHTVRLMALVLFLILGAYYVLKTARQAFILTSSRSPAESLGDQPVVLARRNAELLAGLFEKRSSPPRMSPSARISPLVLA